MQKPVFLFITVFCLVLLSCSVKQPKEAHLTMQEKTEDGIYSELDLQGHRGCRGLLPENTIPGFIRALDLGVTTLEMDVVITKDLKVICSHEPWFSHEIALDPSGMPIEESAEREHAIYKMTFIETQAYDCGSKIHPRFPKQEKMAVTKPLLSSVIDTAEAHAKKTGRSLPFYNIETKSQPDGDEIYHPSPEEFARLLTEEIIAKGIQERSTIQSFDVRTLQVIHRAYPNIKTVLLVENSLDAEENLDILGFVPYAYSPDYLLVNEDMVKFCRSKNMKLIPWTVNETDDMKKLAKMGVDGIISDYPDRFSDLKNL